MSRSQPVSPARAIRRRRTAALLAAAFGVALIAAGVVLSRPDSPASAAIPNPDCGHWQLAAAPTAYLAPNDIYRICADRMQALIVEDEHNTLVEYPHPAN